jgi:hypothetical protein
MNWISRKIELFCYKHPRFGISNLMLYVVIGNVIIWLFSMMDTTNLLAASLQFSPQLILKGQIWRLISFAFVPTSGGVLALIMFYFYYFIGNTLEQYWGKAKFTLFFFSGILFTVIYAFVIYFITGADIRISASYIYLSMFFSFATLFPETQVLLFFIIPMKIKWLAYIDAAFFLYEIIVTPFPYNLIPVVAVLNYLLFCGGWLLQFLGKKRGYNNPKVINYKKAAKQVNRIRNNAPYSRKCEVCGITDVDDPDMEFRYCSRCIGYHCYCSRHINDHIHFTE